VCGRRYSKECAKPGRGEMPDRRWSKGSGKEKVAKKRRRRDSQKKKSSLMAPEGRVIELISAWQSRQYGKKTRKAN